MNTQQPASGEGPLQPSWCGEREDVRPPTVTITRFTEMEKTNMDLLTIEKVAELTRLPVATLRWYRAMGEGGPKSGKLGRRVVYRRADVEAWIAAAFDATGS